MTTPYERQYRKIAPFAAIEEGSYAIFRTGGTMLKLVRSGDRAAAFEITEGNAGEAGIALPAEVREGWVWVCVDLCS